MRRNPRRIVSFALIAGAVALSAVPATGAAAAGWLPAQGMPSVPSDIAVDGEGNVVVVGRGTGDVVRATARPFGGEWAPAVPLTSDGYTDPSPPKVTVDADGNAVAVWAAYSTDVGERVILLANRRATGTWSEPVLFSSDATWFGSQYAIATDGRGITTVVWAELSVGRYTLKGVSRPTGGNWTTEPNDKFSIPSGPEGNSTSPSIGAGRNGAVTVAWIAPNPDSEGPDLVWTSRRSAVGETWSAANDVSDGGVVRAPQVVVDGDGDSTVIWDRVGAEPTVRGVRRSASGSWDLTGTLGDGDESRIAVAPDGTLTVVWVSSEETGEAIRTRTSTNDGVTWSPPSDPLATAVSVGELAYPQVATDAQGDVTAIWGRFDDQEAEAEVARRTGGGAWVREGSLPVGRLAPYPVGTIDARGHVTLAWSAPASLLGSSSIFDPVAPELRNLTVPQTAEAGRPIRVSVEPFDVGAVTTTWSTGGATTEVSGATADLVFPAAGAFTVTVTGEDEAGNETTLSTPITIVPPDVKGPPHRPDDPPVPGPLPDRVPSVDAPALSDLTQTSARWTLRKRRGSRVPVGTSFRFRLDRAAQVRLSFEQLVSGRRSGKRCVKPTKKNRTKRACTRTEQRGSLTVKGKAGTNGVEFRGRVGGRTLKPGRYRVKVTASADGKRSKAVTKTFTIAR